MSSQQKIAEKENVEEKKGNAIFRQELKSLTPECGTKCAIICNIILIIVFLVCGIPIAVATSDTIDLDVDYTNCENHVNSTYCDVTFDVTKDMQKPIYIYYEIHNFYMNHRDFAKSRDFAQNRGEHNIDPVDNGTKRCSGARYMWEMFDNDTSKYVSITNKKLNATSFANPCGLIAKSFFNDSYILKQVSDKNKNKIDKNIIIDESNIANSYDRTYMFKNNKDFADLQWLNYTDEHFMVWMQMESFPNFRKLWGRINSDLAPGQYTARIENKFNATLFGGKKYLILSTSSLVGTSSFFGYTLIVSAIYCAVVLTVIIILNFINKDKKYDYSALKWS